MTHLILCREYPPAPYTAGGIGTYAHHMARLLAEAGETVHMIAQLSAAAPEPLVVSLGGRLVVHRLALDEPIHPAPGQEQAEREILALLAWSTCPTQVFSWQAAKYVERLLETEPIDVIEAQEWEAPLYYLQARRAAGLGPTRQPPCIVHLHSPTRLIFQFNEWDQTLTDFKPLTRFEEYSIRAADALLCPSHYLADQVTALFGLGPGRIEVIPLAMGVETPQLERAPEVWARNSITYVGRLEPRKGVLEWVDAGINIARIDPTVSFDFFGADTSFGGGAGPSVLGILRKRIPRSLRSRFRFHGTRSRDELQQALAQTAVAVVPSRWENFPFTCIEAMATGLPVLASPNGGMTEMIADNESGWITKDGTSAGLETGLLRVLATSAGERQAMGKRAAESIRRLCDNTTIVARQIAFRRRVAQAGTSPSRNATESSVRVTILGDHAKVDPALVAVCERIFAAQHQVGLIAPWTLREGKLDPGPVSPQDESLPPVSVVRSTILEQDPELTPTILREGGWSVFTFPGPPITLLPPDGRRRKRRYSGMALISNQSPRFALQWFFSAPFREKLRWLARIAAHPGRLVKWVAWRIRGRS